MSTYKAVHDIIKSACEELSRSKMKVKFNHGLASDFNVVEEGKMPIVWLLPMSRTFAFINQIRKQWTYTCVVSIYLNDKIDSTPAQQLKLFDQADLIGDTLLTIINQMTVTTDALSDVVVVQGGQAQAGSRSTAWVATGHVFTFQMIVPDTLDYCCDPY